MSISLRIIIMIKKILFESLSNILLIFLVRKTDEELIQNFHIHEIATNFLNETYELILIKIILFKYFFCYVSLVYI